MRLIIFEEGSGYCGKCLKQVPVYRAKIKHTPYLFLTLFTVGIGAIIWIRDMRKKHAWKCLDCGSEVYKIMN
ncbi:MAG: hypothetical protein P8016_16845 [Sedimentisphaerales bacterium]